MLLLFYGSFRYTDAHGAGQHAAVYILGFRLQDFAIVLHGLRRLHAHAYLFAHPVLDGVIRFVDT